MAPTSGIVCRVENITFHSDRMVVTFLETKNNTSRDGFVVPVYRCPDTKLHPVKALQDYVLRTWNTSQQ